jgi:hypothetical protein
MSIFDKLYGYRGKRVMYRDYVEFFSKEFDRRGEKEVVRERIRRRKVSVGFLEML